VVEKDGRLVRNLVRQKGWLRKGKKTSIKWHDIQDGLRMEKETRVGVSFNRKDKMGPDWRVAKGTKVFGRLIELRRAGEKGR